VFFLSILTVANISNCFNKPVKKKEWEKSFFIYSKPINDMQTNQPTTPTDPPA